MKWKRESDQYVAQGALMVAIVRFDAGLEGWQALLTILGRVVHQSEHSSRDVAMGAAGRAARRAWTLRRFAEPLLKFPGMAGTE